MIIAFTGAGISKESGIQTFQDNMDLRNILDRSFAKNNPKKYKETLQEIKNNIRNKLPNDAHIALAEYNIPVITMNIDNLHELANTRKLIKLHNDMDNPVLYGDPAPMYDKAVDMINYLTEGDIFLVVGASRYTQFSKDIRKLVEDLDVEIIEIQGNASVKVRKFLEENIDKVEDFDEKIKLFGEEILERNVEKLI